MCTSQRATSYYLYKHRSRPIVICPRPNQSFYFYLTFYPSFLGFSSFHRLDLVSAASTPWVVVILAYLPSRRRLAEGEAPSSSVDDAPDCRRNRQNWTTQFAKPDNPVSTASSRIFWFLFDSFVEHIFTTPLGNRSSPAMAYCGMEIYNNNIIMTSVYTNLEVQYTNYLPIGNSFDPSRRNYFGRVEPKNLPLNSSAALSQPMAMQRVLPMNDLYG
jgi:hypothetical protein